MTIADPPRRVGRSAKRAISLPENLAKAIDEKVKSGDAPSFSAFVTEAVIERLQAEDFDRLLEDMKREFGPPSEEDYQWARQVLGL